MIFPFLNLSAPVFDGKWYEPCNPIFIPKKHIYQSYAAQRRAAKKRRKSKRYGNK